MSKSARESILETLTIFRHFVELPIRYSDIDMLQHVNNARYLNYLEEARISYANTILGWNGNWKKPDTILAKLDITYRLPVVLTDSLRCYIRCKHIGARSLEYDYLFIKNFDSDPKIAAEAYTLMISFNPELEKTVAFPEAYKIFITDFEPALQKAIS